MARWLVAASSAAHPTRTAAPWRPTRIAGPVSPLGTPPAPTMTAKGQLATTISQIRVLLESDVIETAAPRHDNDKPSQLSLSQSHTHTHTHSSHSALSLSLALSYLTQVLLTHPRSLTLRLSSHDKSDFARTVVFPEPGVLVDDRSSGNSVAAAPAPTQLSATQHLPTTDHDGAVQGCCWVFPMLHAPDLPPK